MLNKLWVKLIDWRLLLVIVLVIAGIFSLARLGLFGHKGAEVTSNLSQKVAGGGFEFSEEQKMKAKIPLGRLRSGGPPKDGIPSIDNPQFVTSSEAEKFLKSDDPVLGLVYKGIVRAYPHRIMNWHEIVNDTLPSSGQAAGDPILVTYCPLCFTGIAFERKIDGQETTFGVSGKLYNSNLVMYDRSSETLWNQLGGEAIIGKHVGKKLKQIPLETILWRDWKTKHPNTQVLSTDTGYNRNYDANPYEGYETNQDTFGTEFEDERLHPKAKIWGIEIDGQFKAYSDEALRQAQGKLTDEFAG
ncbi:DUF3179 domain-containing protein, partial [Candidatus Curtissbacteria bacterium]|nr:DUF3179 domain-containing protein [Candidatus Curtissbacteria bacterium]